MVCSPLIARATRGRYYLARPNPDADCHDACTKGGAGPVPLGMPTLRA